MKIKLINYTPNAIETIYRAFKICVNSKPATEIKIPQIISPFTELQTVPDNDKMIDLIKRHINHESVLEHVSFTFSVEGVSRALSHQLVRHRIASYTQTSQRYVKLGQFEYVIPPEIAKNPATHQIFMRQMETSQQAYDAIVEELIACGRTEKQAIEDARYVFPNACCTNLVWTCNAREFRHFISERDCLHAQWEIKDMAKQALKEVSSIIPFIDYKAKKCGISCFECSNKEV